MFGKIKTLLDRMNSLYPKDYSFRDIYFLTAAAEDEESVPDKAVTGLQGWVDCYGKASIKGMVFCGGVNEPGDIAGKDKLHKAYEMDRNIQGMGGRQDEKIHSSYFSIVFIAYRFSLRK